MISIRLSGELEEKLELLSKEEGVTKSDVIREAIERYVIDYEKSRHPYKTGEDLFGKYGSGDGRLSKEYKRRVKEKIHEKMSR